MTASSQGRVMVLGANGRIGHAAVQAFAEAGWAVLAVSRQAARKPWPAGVQPVRADALDVATLTAAAGRLDVIVQALNPDYSRWAELLPPQTQAVIALAEATGGHVLLAGNVYNFGRELPACLGEGTPPVGNTDKARQRIALEDSLRAATVRGVKTAVIRAGDFLGDAGSWLDMAIAKRLHRGVVTHMGPDDVEHAWAWLPDLARVFVRVAEQRAALAPFESLHFAGLTATGAELHRALEAIAGRPLKRAGFPWWALKLASPAWPMARALLPMRYLWQRPHRLVGTRLQQLIGPLPATPLEVVLREGLAVMAADSATAAETAKPGSPAWQANRA